MKKLNNKGSVIVSILFVTLFLTTVIYALLVLANSNIYRSRGRIFLLQAQYSAESGADSAIAILNSGNESYTGTSSDTTVLTNSSLYKATYSVTVNPGSSAKEKIITGIGKVYTPASAPSPSFTRTIEVVAQRSSITASTALASRNIFEVESGVKNIEAKDVYVNGYINMNKNTTNLIAENITVADKNTTAVNCSIGGIGNLIKPSLFANLGQTKTKISLAYNNCIIPPGNVSDSNFDVFANQTTISKLQSMYIPWSQYMDSSYTSSSGGCSDWTTGNFPRDIPSTGNTKKTHYPDSDSNISSSCGTSGNLNLSSGQYNIKDHVHIRANLCGSSGCNVTFYNPDNGIKFVFVEGTINFSNLVSAPSSGPIVFVAYGSDPATLVSVCPLGGSIYLGTSGSAQTDAPAVYLLSPNGGVCLDKTKFGSAKALGGLSGKNLFIATNTGTPFDLALDPAFPVDQIPVDLFWRAARYRRL